MNSSNINDSTRKFLLTPNPGFIGTTKQNHRLWVGNLGAAQSSDFLKKNNITHIVNVSDYKYSSNPHVVNIEGFEDIQDVSMIPKILSGALHITEKLQYGSVLCHCNIGINRSVSCIMAYLVLKHGMSFESALEQIIRINKKRGVDTLTNPLFRSFIQFLSHPK